MSHNPGPCGNSRLRSVREVEMAHDRLVSILKGAIPNPFGEAQRPFLFAAVDVLCWVLQHEDGDTFGSNLEQIDDMMLAGGFVLEDDEDEPPAYNPAPPAIH